MTAFSSILDSAICRWAAASDTFVGGVNVCVLLFLVVDIELLFFDACGSRDIRLENMLCQSFAVLSCIVVLVGIQCL
ncbi:hypothetical protein [Bifidobacterium bombi]|uniref:hypothetical protein n=1 Tax=Bifidobacterium bombi TaxID=471511 RepID=UPI00126A6F07|nr:hypothetical protein [Bifidobacterium bombi]